MSESKYSQFSLDKILSKEINNSLWQAHIGLDSQIETFILKLATNNRPETQAKLLHEYELLKPLNITGLIRALDIVQTEGQFGLVLEDPKQILLSEQLQQGIIPLDEFLRIAIKLAKTLNKLHASGIIHKDIKPSNILIDPKNKNITLMNLSLACTISRERELIETPVENLEGTLVYLSPEQTGRMNCSIDHRTDFYSLGVTFYQMLTGLLPFEEKNALSIVHAHMTQVPASPHEINANIPQVVSNIVMTLLEKEVTNRYQNAHTLMKDLLHCQILLEKNKVISSFPIRQHDIPAQLTIPEKLYGRKNEIQALMSVYDSTKSGQVEIVTVIGDPGVGKTKVIEAFQYQLQNSPCFFIRGKFDQYKKDYGFYGLAQALTDFIKQISSQNETTYRSWREKIKKTLGVDARIMTNLLPNLIKMIGEPPPLIELDPEKSLNRLLFTISNFINLIATEEHPLVIFFDDLQWADKMTLRWLKEISTPSIIKTKYLMIVGAYRFQEVDKGHPLTVTLNEINKFKPINKLNLSNLTEKITFEWLQEALYTNANECESLANLFYQKTNGNPFYLHTLLYTLYRDKLINFDYNRGGWTWDLEEIKKQKITDNVVEFLIQRLQQLPEDSQTLIKFASCMGNVFSLAELAIITSNTSDKVASFLWPALKKGIIIPLSGAYRFADAQIHKSILTDFDIKYSFAHDRVQQAGYQLLSKNERANIHLRIAKLFLLKKDEKWKEENIIDIVKHYNAGISAITTDQDRLELAMLNCKAANRAQVTSNFPESLIHSKIGIRMLSHVLSNDKIWHQHYDLIYDLHKNYTVCAFALGHYKKAEHQIDLLLEKAKTNLEKIQLYYLSMQIQNAQGKWEKTIDNLIEGSALAKLDIPRHPSFFNLIKEIVTFFWKFGKKDIANLIHLPETTDPMIFWALKLSVAGGVAIIEVNTLPLLVVSTLKTSIYIIKNRGLNANSSLNFISISILSAMLGDYKTANEWQNLIRKINERFPDISMYVASMEANIRFNFWRQPDYSIEKEMQLRKTLLDYAIQIGDKFCAVLGIIELAPVTGTLNEKIIYYKNYLPVVQAIKMHGIYSLFFIEYGNALNEINQTKSPCSLSFDDFDETACINALIHENNKIQLSVMYFTKMSICVREGEYQKGYEYYLKAKKLGALPLQRIMKANLKIIMLSLLCFPPIYEKSSFWQKRTILKDLRNLYKHTKKLAAYNPLLFLPWQHLMEAVLASLSRKTKVAMHYFEIITGEFEKLYQDNKIPVLYFCQVLEITAKFFLKEHLSNIASFYIKRAYTLYTQFGFLRSVQLMEQRYDELLTEATTVKQEEITASDLTLVTSNINLDLSALLQAAQTISSEINLTRLVQNLLRIIIENGGADRGALIILDKNNYFVKAYGNSQNIQLTNVSVANITANALPLSQQIIENVIRLNEPQLLTDARKTGAFVDDPHIKANQVKSVFCIPLIKQKKMIGVIYLENQKIVNAFTKGHQEILNTLSSQAAISLENATLFENTKLLKIAYERFVPKNFLKLLEKDSVLDIEVGDHIARKMTVLFADIRDFTTRSEGMSPRENFRFINEFLKKMEPIIRKHHGFIDKYIGDAIMALFPTNADEAILCAQDMLKAVRHLNKHYPKNPIRIGVGLNTGPLILGIVGGKKRLEGTVISDAVNLASRTESLNKRYHTECLITGNTFRALSENHPFKLKKLAQITVKGKTKLTDIYEVCFDDLDLPIPTSCAGGDGNG